MKQDFEAKTYLHDIYGDTFRVTYGHPQNNKEMYGRVSLTICEDGVYSRFECSKEILKEIIKELQKAVEGEER